MSNNLNYLYINFIHTHTHTYTHTHRGFKTCMRSCLPGQYIIQAVGGFQSQFKQEVITELIYRGANR